MTLPIEREISSATSPDIDVIDGSPLELNNGEVEFVLDRGRLRDDLEACDIPAQSIVAMFKEAQNYAAAMIQNQRGEGSTMLDAALFNVFHRMADQYGRFGFTDKTIFLLAAKLFEKNCKNQKPLYRSPA